MLFIISNHRVVWSEKYFVFLCLSSKSSDTWCSYLLKIIEISWTVLFLAVHMTRTSLKPPTLRWEFLLYRLSHIFLAIFVLWFLFISCILSFEFHTVFFPFNHHIGGQFSFFSAPFLLFRILLRFFVVIWIFLRIFTIFGFLPLPPFCSSVLKPYLRKCNKDGISLKTLYCLKKPPSKHCFLAAWFGGMWYYTITFIIFTTINKTKTTGFIACLDCKFQQRCLNIFLALALWGSE